MKTVRKGAVDINSLIGLPVEHNVTTSYKKSFGSGIILTAENNSCSVDFGETVGVKKFSYPVCFINNLILSDSVSEDIRNMVACDIEAHNNKELEKLDAIHKLALSKTPKVKEFNYVALKRPYVDLTFYCSRNQLKSNVNAKFTMCQSCKCKDCSLGKIDYNDVVKEYENSNGCSEALIFSDYEFKLSKRNKLNIGDVLLFTCIPSGCKEQDRIVYGYSVVDNLVEGTSYYTIKLDKEKTYVFDYETASSFKFWDVMINVKKPDVMLFGNSHCKKMTDMQMAQYLRMMFADVEDEELYTNYKEMLSYIGISDYEIIANDGALVRLENALIDDYEEEEEEEESRPKRNTYVRDEDAYDDIDLD